jgi:hypothetical protein
LSFLNRDHVTVAQTKTVRWDESQGAFTTSQRIDGKFQPVPLTESFALDIHTAQHGYEQWQENGGDKRTRAVTLAPVSRALPAKPTGKSTCIYCMSAYSAEMGGQRELIINGKEPTEAICDLFDEVHELLADLDELVVPIIEVSANATEFGNAPVFRIVDWAQRPDAWIKPSVSFKKG